MEDGVGEVCTDAACVGPDLGKERGHQGDEVSPLTVTDPCNDSPQSTQEELWATGQHVEQAPQDWDLGAPSAPPGSEDQQAASRGRS